MSMSPNDVKDIIIKELEFVQSIISRMAANSFQLKGWLIGILSFVMAFNSEAIFIKHPQYSWFLSMPVIIFWYLDAFFLYTEQQYRELYNDISARRKKYLFGDTIPNELSDLFNLDYTRYEDHRVARKHLGYHLWYIFSTKEYLSLKDCQPQPYKPKKLSTIFKLMGSKTLWVFYMVPLIFITVIVLQPVNEEVDKIQKIELIQQLESKSTPANQDSPKPTQSKPDSTKPSNTKPKTSE